MTADRPARRRLPVVAAAVLAVAGAGWLVACGEGSDPSSAPPGGSPSGADVFAASCASCHGADLRGSDQGPSLLSEVYEPGHHPDDAFRAAVTRGSPAHHWGFGDMPPVPTLDPAEVDAVIAHIRAQQEEHGFEPYPPR